MATAAVQILANQFYDMREGCEIVLAGLAMRERIVAEMAQLGGEIDSAYVRFERSRRSSADLHRLRESQVFLQAKIEKLRSKADSFLRRLWELHKSVSTALDDGTSRFPILLPILEEFRLLPPPSERHARLHILRLRDLVSKSQRLIEGESPKPASAPAEPEVRAPAPSPQSNKTTADARGLLTAGQVAAGCGISPKTIYRLASQGKIPYVRIQSSLRFRRNEVEAWIESKAYRPKDPKR